MKNQTPLWQVTKKLAAVAQGEEPADLVIRDGRLIDVFTGEILDHTGVAIADGRIALVGDVSALEKNAKQVIDAQGMYLAPAFLDGHMHVESSMLTVCEYGKAALPHGTGGIFMDPHEIVNVLGLEGMRAMMADGEAAPIRVYTTTPSCVPASPGLEDNGAVITPKDVAQTMGWEGVAGLGEVMNYPGVLAGDEMLHAEIAETLKARKTITGHYPLVETDGRLNAYLASGVSCCHECTTAEQALGKLRLGMFVMIREGSAWHDLAEVIKVVTEHKIDTRRVVLVSDDIHADDLIHSGHMDYIIRRAIEEGVSPVTAIQMATINCAECFGLSQDLGAIAPGRYADLNLLSDLTRMEVKKVILGGRLAAEEGVLLPGAEENYIYPEHFRKSVKLSRKFTGDDFDIIAPEGSATVDVKTIEIHEANVMTTQTTRRMPVRDGKIQADNAQDILKVAVIDRHHPEGGMALGFVKGFNLKSGAAASTYAHDAHNLLVIGLDEEDMACAVNSLIDCQGGMVVIENGRALAKFEMPIAGLLSDKPAAEVARSLNRLAEAWLELGSPIVSPFMTMSLLSLSVIPEIRITNRGLVDVTQMKLTSLIEKV